MDYWNRIKFPFADIASQKDGTNMNQLQLEISTYVWWYFFAKITELLDTIQFGTMFRYLIFLIAVDSAMPKAVSYFFAAHAIIFGYMFGDFHVKTYKQKEA